MRNIILSREILFLFEKNNLIMTKSYIEKDGFSNEEEEF